MATSLDIVNRALRKIGQAPVVSIDTPNSVHEKTCAAVYDSVRRELLAYHPWNFAEGHHTCSRTGTPSDTNYTDKYRLPNDFLELVEIPTPSSGGGSSFSYSSVYGEVDYTYEGNEILLNNNAATSVNIVYTKNFTDVNKFSPLFAKALVFGIATEICYPITKDAKREKELMTAYEDVRNEAASIDGQGKRVRRIEYSPSIAARSGRRSLITNPYRIGG